MNNRFFELKSWPQFFEPISQGIRTHELRRNEFDFKVNDQIRLREFDPLKSQYTGRDVVVKITSITSSDEPCAVSEEALNKSFCILSVKLINKI